MIIQEEIEALKVVMPRSVVEDRDQMIIRLYQQPNSRLRLVAEAARCGIETVRRVLIRHGIKRNRTWQKS